MLAYPVKMAIDGTDVSAWQNYAKLAELGERAQAEGQVSAGEVAVTKRLIAMQYLWRQSGRVVYELRPELAKAFCETSLPIAAGDFAWPHEMFYIHCPGAGIQVYDGKKNMPLDGIYVSRSQEYGVADILAISQDGQLAFCHVQFLLNQPLDEAMKERATRAEEIGLGPQGENFNDWVRVAMGTCAYLASDNKSQDSEPYEQRKAHRLAAGPLAKKIPDVRVNYFRLGARDDLHVYFQGTDEQRTLTKRHVVRGHYRRLGEDRKRVTWVRPHWKGPSWGEVAAAQITKVT